MVQPVIRALILAASVAAAPIPEGVTIITQSTAGSIGGMMMADQWGNRWVEVTARGDKAVVKVFDCAGKPHIVGEVPISSLGSQNNFAGFKPYLNATLEDLTAVSLQRQYEVDCLYAANHMAACAPNPHRSDCRVMLTPTNGGNMIPADAWAQYQAMHKGRP